MWRPSEEALGGPPCLFPGCSGSCCGSWGACTPTVGPWRHTCVTDAVTWVICSSWPPGKLLCPGLCPKPWGQWATLGAQPTAHGWQSGSPRRAGCWARRSVAQGLCRDSWLPSLATTATVADSHSPPGLAASDSLVGGSCRRDPSHLPGDGTGERRAGSALALGRPLRSLVWLSPALCWRQQEFCRGGLGMGRSWRLPLFHQVPGHRAGLRRTWHSVLRQAWSGQAWSVPPGRGAVHDRGVWEPC